MGLDVGQGNRGGRHPATEAGGELDLARYYANALRHWPRISLAIVAGGVLGLILAWFRPPQFLASATLEIGIDYNRSASMFDPTVEQAFDRVRGLLLGDATLQGALDRTGGIGMESLEEFRSQIRLAQRLSGWDLVVVGPDARRAADLANGWAAEGLDRIEEAMTHAIRAGELQSALYEASCELTPSPSLPERAEWVCRSGAPGQDPEELPEGILREVTLSYGIPPIFSYSWPRRAAMPARPIAWERGTLTLAGGVLGWIGGMVWAADFDGGPSSRTGRDRRQPRRGRRP